MDGYIFDKRKIKKITIKYGLIFLAIFPILVLVGFALQNISSIARITILVVVASALILVIELVLTKIAQTKENAKKTDKVTVKAGALDKRKKTYVSKKGSNADKEN